ncbi:MAG: type II toxin-antitoxin system HicB family antitoxin [Clostridiales bacterium]|jgi:predicted RNase H-like HicB family nuclease|nr:type II toxin-antitoxin system HicB family antitoxin [Clostridiales bacterium]
MVASKPRGMGHNIAGRGGYMAPVLNSVTLVPVYRATIHPCEDVSGYWASCDMENGGCTVQGDSIQETQAMMLESVAIYLEDYPDIKNYRLEFEYI